MKHSPEQYEEMVLEEMASAYGDDNGWEYHMAKAAIYATLAKASAEVITAGRAR